jgi:murein DD-endopeptidase MepM/ murein hydrolase activator NlpD
MSFASVITTLPLRLAAPPDARSYVLPGVTAAAWMLLSVSAVAAGPPDGVTLQPPVHPACISSPFGWRRAIGPHAPAGFHNGIDLPAPPGGEVYAAAGGTVTAIKRGGIGGLTIVVQHADGRSTLYAHLGTVWGRIADGKRRVVAGEPLGHVGWTGITYGTHVFFAVFEGGRAVDPEPLLGVPRCDSIAAKKPP